MGQREANLWWLKDLLEHLTQSHNQLTWTDEPEALQLLLESMQRDLASCERICAEMRKRLTQRQRQAV